MAVTSTYQAWAWLQLLLALDRAGYAIVKKPVLLDKGIARRNR